LKLPCCSPIGLRIVKNQVAAYHTDLKGYVSFEKEVFTFVKKSLPNFNNQLNQRSRCNKIVYKILLLSFIRAFKN